MPDVVTQLSSLINPEVMADMISAKVDKKIRVIPYAKLDTTLQGRAGDTITIPKFGYIGGAEDVNEGAEIPTKALSVTSAQHQIKKIGIGGILTDEAVLSGHGNVVGEMTGQLAKSIAAKCDDDAMDQLLGATTKYTSSTIISYNAVVNAIDCFSEEENSEKVMFVHPKQVTQLRLDSNFIARDKYGNQVMVDGEIGMIGNARIVASKKVKKNDAIEAEAGVYKLTIGGTVASGDEITVAAVATTLDGTSGASAAAAATAVAAQTYTNYSATSSGAVVTFTEKSTKEGTGKPSCSIVSTAGTVAMATDTEGVAGVAANTYYLNPIVKLENDAESEEDSPAITVFLKRDTNIETDRQSRKRQTEITGDRMYVVALTNETKVVVAKNLVVAAV